MAFFKKKEEKIVDALTARNSALALSHIRDLLKSDSTLSNLARVEVIREAKLSTLKSALGEDIVSELKQTLKKELSEEQIARQQAALLVQLKSLLANTELNKVEILQVVAQYDVLLRKAAELTAQNAAQIQKREEKLRRDIEELQTKEALAKQKAKLAEAHALAEKRIQKAALLADVEEDRRLAQAKTALVREQEKQQFPGLINAIRGLFGRTIQATGKVAEGTGELAVGVGTGGGRAAAGIGKGTGYIASGAGVAIKETGGFLSVVMRKLAGLFGK